MRSSVPSPRFETPARHRARGCQPIDFRLRQARLDKGFETAAAAADAHGWSRNTYAANENGNAPFSYRRAKEYAAAFGVSPLRLP